MSDRNSSESNELNDCRVEEDLGLVCRKCGNTTFYVTDTRRGEDLIMRRRRCLKCGRRIITEEKMVVE